MRSVLSLSLAAGIFMLGLLELSRETRASEAGTAAPTVTRPAPTPAECVRATYLALVQTSIVPANPRDVAVAALRVIGTLTKLAPPLLPEWFGADAARDADWLAQRSTGVSLPWPVLEAMARAAQTAHVGFGSPERKKGLRARGLGEPLSAPGFNTWAQSDGRFVVFDVVPGASAEVSGLRQGDILLSVDGHPSDRFDPFILSALPADVDVKLEIERAQQRQMINLHLIPADVPAVESRVLPGNIGYLFIRWFAVSKNAAHDTAAQTLRALQAFAEKNVQGLVLDLRSSLGGSGEVEIASALCDGDIVYAVKAPTAASTEPVKRAGPRIWPDRPIAVLINAQTISAGETLALALRELGLAKIVGQTSGGGLTEFTFVPLADGYSITIPESVVLGPVSGVDQPQHALRPDLIVANSTGDDLRAGRDRPLEAAVSILHDALRSRSIPSK